MKLKDSLLIAYTKYRTKRARSILATIGASFLLSILLFMTLAGTGIRNTILNNGVSANTNGLFLAGAASSFDPIDTTSTYYENAVKNERSRLALAGIPFTNLYTSTNITGHYSYGGSFESDAIATTLDYGQQAFLEMVDQEMMSPFLPGDRSGVFDKKTESGAIPALISIDLLTKKYETELGKYSSAKAKQAAIEEYKEELLTKDITIQINQSTTTATSDSLQIPAQPPQEATYSTKVRVVGFLPASNSFVSSYSGTFTPSQMQLPRHLALEEPFTQNIKNNPPSYFFTTFKTKEDRKKLLETFSHENSFVTVMSSNTTYISPYGSYADPSAATDGMYDLIKNAFKFFIIVMILFVTLPMSGTISKILADSQRETGVFRAIGAKNRDIFKIYLVYSGLLATLAYIVAFGIATLLCVYITARYGANLAGELSVFTGGSTSYDVIFFGINPLHLLFLYVLIVLSAMLGVIGPVIKTLRRDPVVAMRED